MLSKGWGGPDGTDHVESASLEDHTSLHAASTVPEGVADFLLPKPETLRQARGSRQWLHCQRAMAVDMVGIVKSQGVGQDTVHYEEAYCRDHDHCM